MLACARIGAVHSVVFGGFAAQRAGDPHRRRQAEASFSRPAAGSSPAASSHYKPLLDEAIALAAAQAERLHRSCSAPQARGRHGRGPRP